MSFTINEEITTTLHYKDVALIAVAFSLYKETCKDRADKEITERIDRLVNRLGHEMYDHPDNNEPNSH